MVDGQQNFPNCASGNIVFKLKLDIYGCFQFAYAMRLEFPYLWNATRVVCLCTPGKSLPTINQHLMIQERKFACVDYGFNFPKVVSSSNSISSISFQPINSRTFSLTKKKKTFFEDFSSTVSECRHGQIGLFELFLRAFKLFADVWGLQAKRNHLCFTALPKAKMPKMVSRMMLTLLLKS